MEPRRSPDTTTLPAGGRCAQLRIVESEDQHVDAAVVVVPAMGMPARHYDGFASALAASGCHVLTVELPGCGDSAVTVGRDTHVGYQDLLDVDVDIAVSFAEAQWPSTRRVLVGHSLGGQLAVLYAAARPDKVSAVALTAAGSVHWKAYPLLTGLGVLAFTQFARAVAAILGVFPGDRLGFGGRQPRRLIQDWARTAISGRWRPAGSTVDYHELLAALPLPVLAVTLEDDRFAPASSVDALTRPLPDGLVDRAYLSADQMRGAATHLRWLRTPQPVAATVSAWLAAHLDQSSAGTPTSQGLAPDLATQTRRSS